MTSEYSNVVQFTDFARTSTRSLTPRDARRSARAATEPSTETAKNHRMRQARREAWWRAVHVTDYWRARLNWQSALQCAQSHGIANSASFPPATDTYANRVNLVQLWREALVRQMLTPAPDIAAVNWKKAKFATGQHEYTDTNPERIERAIAADVEWLSAHPSRKSLAASRQRAD